MVAAGMNAVDGATAPLRHVTLPRGATLTVRPMRADDVDALVALYAGLDHDSRYRRFFSVFKPARPFFERMAAVGDRGGAGLVAVAADGTGSERLVGEASFEPLPNGDGELAITVDRRWRGWLGPYLLDALVEAAGQRGVANLEADILTTNAPMLALARARSFATMPSADWTVTRVVLGAASRTPSWPPNRTAGRRVVVEGAGGHWHAADHAKELDLEILGCPGPTGRRFRCPVLAGEPCPLADGADVIVVTHPPDTPAWHAVRDAHSRAPRSTPVCVESGGNGSVLLPNEIRVPGGEDAVSFVAGVAHGRR